MRGCSVTLVLMALAAALSGCSDDESNPLSPEEQQLIGTWQLDLGEVDAEDFAFTYRFSEDHTVRNRIGGAFLRRLRDQEALQEADLGQLSDLDEIDGATVTWRGTWALEGDSLMVFFDRLQVDVIGRLPLIGDVSVPVHEEILTPQQQTEVAYTYQVTDSQLIMRGAAASAGVVDDNAEAQTAGLDPLAAQALQVASEALLEAYQDSEANEFVYLRQ